MVLTNSFSISNTIKRRIAITTSEPPMAADTEPDIVEVVIVETTDPAPLF